MSSLESWKVFYAIVSSINGRLLPLGHWKLRKWKQQYESRKKVANNSWVNSDFEKYAAFAYYLETMLPISAIIFQELPLER